MVAVSMMDDDDVMPASRTSPSIIHLDSPLLPVDSLAGWHPADAFYDWVECWSEGGRARGCGSDRRKRWWQTDERFLFLTPFVQPLLLPSLPLRPPPPPPPPPPPRPPRQSPPRTPPPTPSSPTPRRASRAPSPRCCTRPTAPSTPSSTSSAARRWCGCGGRCPPGARWCSRSWRACSPTARSRTGERGRERREEERRREEKREKREKREGV